MYNTIEGALTSAAAAQAVDRWEDPRILRRYARHEGTSVDDAARCFVALKQFLAVCALSDAPRSPSYHVDEMWHTALMFSRSYHDFCWEHLHRFIHHEPLESLAEPELYAATREHAETVFGTLDEQYWPIPEHAPRCGSMYVP